MGGLRARGVVAAVVLGLLGLVSVGSPVVPASPAGATPSWPVGLSVVASGFTFVDPQDVALSPTERFVYVLDDVDRVVKVDTDTDTASVLTKGINIDVGQYLAVRGSDGAVVVSTQDSSGANPKLVVVDRNTGSQSVLTSSLGR